MKIGYDIDGVLIDFITPYLWFHNKKYGTRFQKEDIKNYDLTKSLKLPSKKIFPDIMQFMESKYSEYLVPAESTQEAISEIAMEHDLYVITSRSELFKRQTEEMLSIYFPNIFDGRVIFSSYNTHKWGNSKSSIAESLRLEIFIEDNPDDISSITAKGIRVFLMDAPWNRKVKENSLVTRVYNHSEIVRILKSGLNNR